MQNAGAIIAGMGVVSAIGQDLPAFTQSLQSSRSGIKRSQRPIFASHMVALAAEIEHFDFASSLKALDGLTPDIQTRALRAARRVPWSTQAALIAALQAWLHAQSLGLSPDPADTALIIAADHANARYLFEQQAQFEQAPTYLSPRFGLHAMDSDVLGVISHTLALRGEGLVTAGASATGNVALIQGLRLLNERSAQSCLVVAPVADWSALQAQAFHALGVLGGQSDTQALGSQCQPFDEERTGLAYGQASAAVLLVKPTQDQHTRQRLPRLRSGASRLHASAWTEPNEEAEAAVMRAAIAAAGLVPAQIDYINTHGTASLKGDQAEVSAIKQVFGNGHCPWINASKALTGHCMTSAGIVEAIACAVQIQGSFLHGNPNLTTPIDTRLRWVSQEAEAIPIRTALSNSFGFGGVNTSIVIDNGSDHASP